MKRRLVVPGLALALACGLSAAPPRAHAEDVAGVPYEPTAQVGSSRLLLNGAGVRYKLIFKVYAAGLYTSVRATTPDAVYNAPGPRHLHIVMLRAIDAHELGKLFTQGMEKNVPAEIFARSINGTLRLADLFSRRHTLAAGESFDVDWLPGTGTVVSVNGHPETEPIKEPEFFTALMSIWLGPHPADEQLKQALLGHRPVTRPYGS